VRRCCGGAGGAGGAAATRQRGCGAAQPAAAGAEPSRTAPLAGLAGMIAGLIQTRREGCGRSSGVNPGLPQSRDLRAELRLRGRRWQDRALSTPQSSPRRRNPCGGRSGSPGGQPVTCNAWGAEAHPCCPCRARRAQRNRHFEAALGLIGLIGLITGLITGAVARGDAARSRFMGSGSPNP